MYKIWLLSFVLTINLQAKYIVQLKDFLCGCDYCNTISTSETLHIGTHMIMCHSWRKSTLKTIEIMRQQEQKKINLEKKAQQLEQPQVIKSTYQIISSSYTWSRHDLYGLIYSNTNNVVNSMDRWLYNKDFKWVWSIAGMKNFLYSYEYGWLYVDTYQQLTILYVYDEQSWILANMLD